MPTISDTAQLVARTRFYRDAKAVDSDFEPAEISEHLEDASGIVWLDLQRPTAADLEVVTQELGLHPLAVEDALHPHQRPKVDSYGSHLFLTVYMVSVDADTNELFRSELNAFITNRAVVTVHDGDIDLDALERRWLSLFGVVGTEVGAIVHGILDQAVDGYFAIVQELDDDLEGLENMLFDDSTPSREVQRQSFNARKSLVVLRRVAMPMREVLNTLMRRDVGMATPQLVPYYQDVYDHVLRVTEWTDSLRDLVATILDTNLSVQSNRLNEVMRKLTAWAAIIAVPTAITGFYGQNVPYPGSGQHWGAITSTALLIIISLSLAGMFMAKRWL